MVSVNLVSLGVSWICLVAVSLPCGFECLKVLFRAIPLEARFVLVLSCFQWILVLNVGIFLLICSFCLILCILVVFVHFRSLWISIEGFVLMLVVFDGFEVILSLWLL